MPSPEAGEGRLTGISGSQPTDEFENGLLDHELALAGSLPSLGEPSGARHEQLRPLTSTSAYFHEPHEDITEIISATRTVPTKVDDPIHSGVIGRPRSSGDPPDMGFKFEKATAPQADMTRQRGSKVDKSSPGEGSKALYNENVSQRPKMKRKSFRASEPSSTHHSSGSREGARSPRPASHLQEPQTLPEQGQHLPNKTATSNAARGKKSSTQGRRQQRVNPLPILVTPVGQVQESPLPASGLSSNDMQSHPAGSPEPWRSPRVIISVSAADPPDSTSEPTNDVLNSTSAPCNSHGRDGHAEAPNFRASHLWNDSVKRQGDCSPPAHEKADNLTETSYQKDRTGAKPFQEQPLNQNAAKQQALPNMRRPQPNNPVQGPELSTSRPIDRGSSLNGPTRVTKLIGTTKANRPNDFAGAANASLAPGPKIHSSEVLSIWQKLFEKEQQELSSREKQKRDSVEQELAKLRHAEEKQSSALEVARKSKLDVSTKLKQVQNANKELRSRVQELERSCEDTSKQLKSLQDDQHKSAQFSSDLQKEVGALEAEKKGLIASNESEKRRSFEELSMVREELREKKFITENAIEIRKILEKELHEKAGCLTEERDRSAYTKSHLAASQANYEEITAKIRTWDDSLTRKLAGMSEALEDLRQSHPAKDAVEEILSVARKALHPTAATTDVEAMLQSFSAAVQSSLDNARKAEEAVLKGASAFEARLFIRLHEEFKISVPLRDEIAENQKKIAILEERCSALISDKARTEEQLKVAQSGEACTRDNLEGLRSELSQVKSHLTSVDSARLRQLESEKTRTEQELRIALSKVHDEEENRRFLGETERELRQTVVNLKASPVRRLPHLDSELLPHSSFDGGALTALQEQLKEAETRNSHSQAETDEENQDSQPLKQIADLRENIRAYYADICKKLVEEGKATYENELKEEKHKRRHAEDSLQSQATQIAAHKEQIRLQNIELQKAKVANPMGTTEVQNILHQLDAERAEKASIQEQGRLQADQHSKELEASLEKVKTESTEKLRNTQQQLNALQSRKQESEAKLQQVQELNQTIQEQLETSSAQCDELGQKLAEAEILLDKSHQEAIRRETEAEEDLRQCEGQWAAENEDLRRLLQAAHARAEESEASHQLKCEEYEDRLRNYLHALEKQCLKQQEAETTQHTVAPRRVLQDSRDSNSAPLDAPVPAANSGQRRPRRKLDRSISASNNGMQTMQSDEGHSQRQLYRDQGTFRPGSESSESQRLETPRSPGETTFEDNLWASEEIGRYETLTEHGVHLRSSEDEPFLEIPETLLQLPSNPPLFSEFHKERGEQRKGHSSSSLSTMATPSVEKLMEDSEESREAASSPTQRLSGRAITKQTQMSIVNPFFEEDRPVSQANVSKRIESTTQARRGSLRATEQAFDGSIPDENLTETSTGPSGSVEDEEDDESSPPFMSEPSQRNVVVYGHNRSSQYSTGQDASYHVSTPSGAIKRRASGTSEWTSSKQIKTSSTTALLFKSSPRVTRASAKAGPRSHVSETQSQEQGAALTAGSQTAPVKSESQSQSRVTSTKSSQSQSRKLANVPAASLMRTSIGSSSMTGTSPVRNLRRRRTSAMSGRFDAEIQKRQ